MSATLGRKAKKDRVWIKAGYAPALLEALQTKKKKWETIPKVIARLLTLASAQSDRANRRKRLS
jgi:hypothetical protein